MTDKQTLQEQRKAALQEAKAIEAYLKGRLDYAALQVQLRRAQVTREKASQAKT